MYWILHLIFLAYQCNGLLINRSYSNMFITDVSDITSLRFQLKACRDAHFLFYSDTYELIRVVIIGSAGHCDIRYTFYSSITAESCYVSCSLWTTWWISWEADYVEIGNGLPGQNVITADQSPTPLNIKYMSHLMYRTFSWEIIYLGNNMDTLNSQYKRYSRRKDTRSGSIWSVNTTQSPTSCGKSCGLMANCFGFNFNPFKNSENNCELLSSEYDAFLDPPVPLTIHVRAEIGWDFYIGKLN